MCGIVGYVSRRNAAPMLVDGLKRLECRGYDSAGVAVVHDGRLEVRRSVGKIAALESVLAGEPLQGALGVAHTRWATHGKPCDASAPASRLLEGRRGRPQRHHREPRAPAEVAPARRA